MHTVFKKMWSDVVDITINFKKKYLRPLSRNSLNIYPIFFGNLSEKRTNQSNLFFFFSVKLSSFHRKRAETIGNIKVSIMQHQMAIQRCARFVASLATFCTEPKDKIQRIYANNVYRTQWQYSMLLTSPKANNSRRPLHKAYFF